MVLGWTSWTSWLLSGVGFLVALLIWRDRQQQRKFRELCPKGPQAYPLLGNWIFVIRLGINEALKKWGEQYGKVYGLYSATLGSGLVISDLDIIKEIMVKQFAHFPNRVTVGIKTMGKPWNLLLTSIKDDHWKHVRSQLSPTFSTGKIKKMIPAIQKVCQSLQTALEKKAESGELVELKQLSGTFSMDVIAAAAFGIDIDTVQNPDEQFVKHALAFEKPRPVPMILATFFPNLARFFMKIGLGIVPKQCIDFFMDITDVALIQRRQDEKKHSDFLQLLVEAEREGEDQREVDKEIDHGDQLTTSTQWTRKGLTIDEMRANAMLFILAGYGTVSTVLSFTLFCLANCEECLKKAQAEVDEKLGERLVDYDTANDLTYIDMCINEAMRLYPPGFIINREVHDDVEVDGVQMKRGWSVTFPVYNIHTDPDLWPDPMKYDPERHTAEERTRRHPCAFMPFGLGPRNCIGMRLAQLEIRMALASVLQKFTPVVCEKSVYPPKLSKLQMAANDGLWVKCVAREN